MSPTRIIRASMFPRRSVFSSHRFLSTSNMYRQRYQPPPPTTSRDLHTNFYRSHGRALFKALTLAFFSYQVFYWAWLTLETETLRDEKGRKIRELEGEVKLLSSGQGSHLLEGEGKRLLEDAEE